MINIVKRLIEIERDIREKDEWFKNFFEFLIKIISFLNVENIVGVIGEYSYGSLGFFCMSIYYDGDDKRFKILS